MRYLGGKYRIAKQIAACINSSRNGRIVWDAFCGGLSVASALNGEVIASDINPDLIDLYNAVSNGWDPPKTLTREEWQAAKTATNPLKAFAGFGCSFGGIWFSSYAGARPNNRGTIYEMASSSRNQLLKQVPKVKEFSCVSFFDIPVKPRSDLIIYADPPYRGVAGYTTGDFDHNLFETRVKEWSMSGVPVYVSEYSFPIGVEVWSATKPNGSACFANKVEKLFLV